MLPEVHMECQNFHKPSWFFHSGSDQKLTPLIRQLCTDFLISEATGKEEHGHVKNRWQKWTNIEMNTVRIVSIQSYGKITPGQNIIFLNKPNSRQRQTGENDREFFFQNNLYL